MIAVDAFMVLAVKERKCPISVTVHHSPDAHVEWSLLAAACAAGSHRRLYTEWWPQADLRVDCELQKVPASGAHAPVLQLE